MSASTTTTPLEDNGEVWAGHCDANDLTNAIDRARLERDVFDTSAVQFTYDLNRFLSETAVFNHWYLPSAKWPFLQHVVLPQIRYKLIQHFTVIYSDTSSHTDRHYNVTYPIRSVQYYALTCTHRLQQIHLDTATYHGMKSIISQIRLCLHIHRWLVHVVTFL